MFQDASVMDLIHSSPEMRSQASDSKHRHGVGLDSATFAFEACRVMKAGSQRVAPHGKVTRRNCHRGRPDRPGSFPALSAHAATFAGLLAALVATALFLGLIGRQIAQVKALEGSVTFTRLTIPTHTSPSPGTSGSTGCGPSTPPTVSSRVLAPSTQNFHRHGAPAPGNGSRQIRARG